MQKKLLWKIGGEAGFGIMTTGLSFSKICTRQGFSVFDYTEYPSLIRGGHNTYEVIFSSSDPLTTKKEIDILVCLNKETLVLNKERITKNTLIIFDKEEFLIDEKFFEFEPKIVNIPFKQIITDEAGSSIMVNNIALGASLALLNWDFEVFEKIIENEFKKKDEKIIKKNKQVASAGFYHVKRNYQKYIISGFEKKEEIEDQIVVTGNEAHSLGLMVGGLRFHASYPMTPASSVLTVMANYGEKIKTVVRHSEDEIAAILNALGASYAGLRSSVATSGGGFALMVESISLAGIAEIPILVFLAQRPGPATGMPTWTEQGDLLFAVNSGHGEFPKIVLAPANQEEMYELTAKGLNLADIYQCPVIVLSDKYLSESHKSIKLSKFNQFLNDFSINRGKIVDKLEDSNNYLRYKLSADGISTLAIPNPKNPAYQVNSYEHLQDGHTTEDSFERLKQVDKRKRKVKTYLKNDFELPKVIGDIKNTDYVFVSFGSTHDIIVSAMEQLKDNGVKTSLIHFSYIYPLNVEKVQKIFEKDKKYIIVENNSEMQFGKLLKQEFEIDFYEKILKFDGRPIFTNEIVEKVINLDKNK